MYFRECLDPHTVYADLVDLACHERPHLDMSFDSPDIIFQMELMD